MNNWWDIAGRLIVSREYIARNPKTGATINRKNKAVKTKRDFSALSPPSGPWQEIPELEILSLARGQEDKIEIKRDKGNWILGRIDAIKALYKVPTFQLNEAHDALIDALDDDFPDARIAGLKALPAFSLRKQDMLFQCLSDRILDEHEGVREVAIECLKMMAPIFPSGCEIILRRELRNPNLKHRMGAFEALRNAAKDWPEVGCLHIDELIREDDDDLRIRGSKILRFIVNNGGAEVWDLISWSLQDEHVQVRRNAAKTLTSLANVEPKIAAILVEYCMGERDGAIIDSAIRAMKKLDIQSPRVVRMIMQGASDSKLELRKACVSQLSIILSGPELREAASELLKKETNKDLRKRLTALARDIDIDGSEDEKNRKLAPLEKTIILLPEMENDDFESEKEGDMKKRENDK